MYTIHGLPIHLERKKIKNLYLRVHPDGRITLSAPKRLPDKVIQDFLNSKSDWILAQREKMLSRQGIRQKQEFTYTTGETHYLWGQAYTLVVEETSGRSSVSVGSSNGLLNNKTSAISDAASFDNETAENIIRMLAPPDSMVDQRKHLLDEFYRKQLKEAIPPLMDKYVQVVGKTPLEWRIKNMKTKWGTCNVVDKRIWLSLQLAKKDMECLEYVIVHELTHLHEPNHSPKFWAYMDRFYPDWRRVRKSLNGR